MNNNHTKTEDTCRRYKKLVTTISDKEMILKVSGNLFWQKGYLVTRVNDIVKAPYINNASICYYFTNNTQVL